MGGGVRGFAGIPTGTLTGYKTPSIADPLPVMQKKSIEETDLHV